MYECFHCGSRSVCWDSDFDFEDFGMEGEGIVHVLHCSNCGAEIEYYIPMEESAEKRRRPETNNERHGKWISIDGCMTICSKCGSIGCNSKYCPNCGAQMK